MTDPILSALQSAKISQPEKKKKPEIQHPSEDHLKKISGYMVKLPRTERTESESDNPYDDYGTLDKKKKSEETRKLMIQNEQSMNNLFSRPLFISMMAELSQSIQTAFIDVPRRESPRLAAILGIPEKEKDLEIELSDIIEKGILAVQGNIERLSDDGIFE